MYFSLVKTNRSDYEINYRGQHFPHFQDGDMQTKIPGQMNLHIYQLHQHY